MSKTTDIITPGGAGEPRLPNPLSSKDEKGSTDSGESHTSRAGREKTGNEIVLAKAVSRKKHPEPVNKSAKAHMQELRRLGYRNLSDTGIEY